MENNSLLIEYENKCNELKNRLFHIRQRFEFLKANLKIDYANGVVNVDDYRRLILLPIDEYAESSYSLSYDDVEFVKKYAELDSHGEIMACLLKSEYLDKLDVMRKLYRSIEVFNLYSNMDLEQRKEYFLNELSKRHDEMVSELHGDIKIGKKSLDDLLSKQQGIVNKCSIEQLIFCIQQFYDVDYSFYEWFVKMSLKDEYDNGFVFGEHIDNSSKISIKLNDLDSCFSVQDKVMKDYFELMNCYILFSEGILTWKSSRRKHFFKRKLSIHDYYDLFKNVSCIPGALKYFDKYKLESNDVIDVKSCFDVYNSIVYQSRLDGISEDDYVKDLFKNILLYFKSKMETLKNELLNSQSELGDIQKALSVLAIKNMNGAQLENDIFMNLDSFGNLMIPNFNVRELRKIYEDLVTIVYDKNSNCPTEGFKK